MGNYVIICKQSKIFAKKCKIYKQCNKTKQNKTKEIKMCSDTMPKNDAPSERIIESTSQSTPAKPTPAVLTLQRLAKETSESLVDKFDLWQTLPVDLTPILKHYGVTLYETDFSSLEQSEEMFEAFDEKGDILGAVVVNNDQIKILFKEDDSIHRQRFTIAHELAHCCLGSEALAQTGHVEFRRDLDSNTPHSIEFKANVFAGELLVPKKALDAIYLLNPIPKLSLLAKYFDVSVNVMRARLDYLRLPYKLSGTGFDYE